MVERRRGPGRPAYDSKQKLVAAACKLLSERGFEATSPVMIQQRSGIGQGSMCHHFLGKGKEGAGVGCDQSHAGEHARVPRRDPHTSRRRR